MRYSGTRIDWPLDINQIRKNSLSHTFGMVRRNADGSPRPHQGWDFYAEEGTPCYSVADGKVEYAGTRGALGNLVVISIADTGTYAAYAHLRDIAVKVGDRIQLGTLIGHTGNTGNASSMKGKDQHLHFEVRLQVITGLGLEGRISPLKIFGKCPINTAELRKYE